MKKTIPVRLSILWLVALIEIFSIGTSAFGDEKRPNVIVILADDLGYGDLSSYGGWIQTPNLDKLSENGLKMMDFHSNGAVCSPTRGAWLTGRYPAKTGVDGVVFAANQRAEHLNGLQKNEYTIASHFNDAGYPTAIFGKWHLGYYRKYNPTRHGFDEFKGYVSGNIDFFSHIDQSGYFDWWHGEDFVEEKGYVTHLITQHSISFIKKQISSGKPFFLYCSHEAPHYPYQGPNDQAERQELEPFNTQGQRKDKKNAYKEMVTEMDSGIGQIVQTLKELHQLDNTIILFFSDNGANSIGSNKPFKGHKGSLWEGGHRVPAIWHWPGHIGSGHAQHQLMSGVDIFPTLSGLTGMELDKDPLSKLDGIDLSKILLNQETTMDDRYIYWEHGKQKAIRHGKIKWIHDGQKSFIYDLDESPDELVEMAQKSLAEKYYSQWKDWRRKAEESRTPQPSDEIGLRKPRVLIVGDSISIGFMKSLKQLRGDQWEIHHTPGNARYASYGTENIQKWIGDDRWDVIHFNWGLWDLCYRHPKSKVQGNRDKINGKLTATVNEYQKSIEKTVKILRRYRASLVWASTTPVPEGEAGRFAGSEVKYNAAAKEVMEKYNIPINDLHAAVASNFSELAIKPGDVHFSQKGYKILAEEVAKAVDNLIKK